MMSRRTIVLAFTAGTFLAGVLPVFAKSRHSNWIRMFDTDNDGTVDLAEAKKAASALFDKLDRDHDGTLDKRELARRLTPKEFAAADPDHDGTLTKDEYLAVVEQRFTAADPDHDGTLDAKELNTKVLPNRGFPSRLKRGRFCGHFRQYCSLLFVSGDTCGLSGRFLASCLCIQKFRSRRLGSSGNDCRAAWKSGILGRGNAVSTRGRYYCGFNPSASNWWLHSAGASRNRSTPMPRGSRPSTAALTRSGARNASEMVILT